MPAVDLSGSHYAYLSRACVALSVVSLLLIGLIGWNVREARAIRAQAMQVEQALVRVQEQDRQVQLRGQMEGVDLSDPAMGRLTAQVGFANDLIAKREESSGTAVDDLNAYAGVVQAHADGIKKLGVAFAPLYSSMSAEQKKLADDAFSRRAHAGKNH